MNMSIIYSNSWNLVHLDKWVTKITNSVVTQHKYLIYKDNLDPFHFSKL